jgi:hypothetical protein
MLARPMSMRYFDEVRACILHPGVPCEWAMHVFQSFLTDIDAGTARTHGSPDFMSGLRKPVSARSRNFASTRCQ